MGNRDKPERLRVHGQTPQIDPDAYIAPGARLIGNVRVDAGASVWFNAVIRADDDVIQIGPGSNVQDGAVLHVDRGFPLTVGRDVTIGHNAIIHGATLDDEVLIGMGATVLNGARIGTGSIVGANALVPEGRDIPPNSLVLGVPGKIARATTDEDRAMIRRGAASYQRRAIAYRDGAESV